MKYFYQKPKIYIDIYGKTVVLDHPIYQKGTKISTDGKAIIIVQQRFQNKTFFWDSVDPWIVSDIYLNKNFPSFFFTICFRRSSYISITKNYVGITNEAITQRILGRLY